MDNIKEIHHGTTNHHGERTLAHTYREKDRDRRRAAYRNHGAWLSRRIRAKAENHVCEQFGIAELKAKRDACLERIEQLNEETSRLEGECHELLETMLHKLSGKQGGPKKYGVYRADSEFTRLMGEEQKKVSAQLMAEDELGRRILELQHEEEEMLDTIWLATTSKQLQSLWITLTDVLNQPLTSFQRELLKIKPSANQQE